jgi:hypothetical protein
MAVKTHLHSSSGVREVVSDTIPNDTDSKRVLFSHLSFHMYNFLYYFRSLKKSFLAATVF